MPLPLELWLATVDRLVEAGVRRVNFSGGEPTLHRGLGAMLRHAQRCGMQTSIITNGARWRDGLLEHLDLVGLSVDSADENVLAELGRRRHEGRPYLPTIRAIIAAAHQADVRVKINSVVTQLNLDHDLRELLVGLRPWKWKPLQFTHVPGENDGEAPHLAVSAADYQRFVDRHRTALEAAGIWVADETDAVVRSTYAMIDPSGCAFRSGPAGYVVSQPVHEVGLSRALDEVGNYDRAAFLQRGGHVDVRRLVRGERSR